MNERQRADAGAVGGRVAVHAARTDAGRHVPAGAALDLPGLRQRHGRRPEPDDAAQHARPLHRLVPQRDDAARPLAAALSGRNLLQLQGAYQATSK